MLYATRRSLLTAGKTPRALLLLVVGSLVGVWGCSGSTLPDACSAATCAGCCTAGGQCETGDTISACGSHGATCSVCTDVQECTEAACVPVSGPDAGPPADAGCPNCLPDAGSGLVLSVNDFDDWCTVSVNGAPLSLSGSYTFDAGTVVSLAATANTDFVWAYWLGTDGANAGNNGQDPHMMTTVTMTANMQVLACCNNAVEKCPTSL
jgi:hypothetical protein